MEISIPPQEAASRLDKLINEGYKLLKKLRNFVYKSHSTVNPLSEDEITFEDYERYEMEILNWERMALDRIQNIFTSKAAAYQFENEGSSLKDNPDEEYHPDGFFFLERLLDSKLKVLSRYYEEISPYSKPVLTFDKEKSILYFGENECRIQKGTKQGNLIRFLFISEEGVGEPIPLLDIHQYIAGEMPRNDKWRKKMKYTIDEINKKTKKKLGFNVLKKEGGSTVRVVISPDS